MNKSEIRSKYKQIRAQMGKGELAEKSSRIAKIFLASKLYQNAKSVMLYMPIGNEVDTDEIVKKAYADGKKVIFPVTDSDYNIIPYYANEDTEFKISVLSISEPIKTQLACSRSIDVVIVPGIAFDIFGGRIGFGKGCYDRFLKDTNATRVGICYECQLCDEISAEPYDKKMDYVMTENKIRNTNKEEE